MSKKNKVFFPVAILVSAFLLWLWFFLGFNHVDAPLDLVLSIIWWVIIAVVIYTIVKAEKKRRFQIRTIYIGEDSMYNSELGMSELGEDLVLGMAEALSSLEYGFDTEDEDLLEDMKSLYIVKSDKFDIDDDGNVKEWEGEVIYPARDVDPVEFETQEELAALLA